MVQVLLAHPVGKWCHPVLILQNYHAPTSIVIFRNKQCDKLYAGHLRNIINPSIKIYNTDQ